MTIGGPADQAQPETPLSRVFVVGCPRSGTTLAQAMLGAHPDVFTFPESHFFLKVWGRLWPSRRFGVVVPRAARHALRNTMGLIGARIDDPPTSIRFRPYARRFAVEVDHAAHVRSKRCWVEKSPVHLHCMREITSVIPDAHFVHVVRNGVDVVNSFYDLCLTNPNWVRQVLPGSPRDHLADEGRSRRILWAIAARWAEDVERTQAALARPRQIVLLYDELVRAPRESLSSALGLLGLGFDEAVLRHWEAADDVVGWRRDRPHMRAVFSPIDSEPATLTRSVLDESMRAQVAARLPAGGVASALFPSVSR